MAKVYRHRPPAYTVSTVGMPMLDKLLKTKNGHVHLAVFPCIAPNHPHKESEKKHREKFGNNKHPTLSMSCYKSMIAHHAQALYKFINKVGLVKVNLIPYN